MLDVGTKLHVEESTQLSFSLNYTSIPRDTQQILLVRCANYELFDAQINHGIHRIKTAAAA